MAEIYFSLAGVSRCSEKGQLFFGSLRQFEPLPIALTIAADAVLLSQMGHQLRDPFVIGLRQKCLLAESFPVTLRQMRKLFLQEGKKDRR